MLLLAAPGLAVLSSLPLSQLKKARPSQLSIAYLDAYVNSSTQIEVLLYYMKKRGDTVWNTNMFSFQRFLNTPDMLFCICFGKWNVSQSGNVSWTNFASQGMNVLL